MKLRRNWVVEELVANFIASRKNMLAFAHAAMQVSQDVVAGETRQVKRRKVADTREASNGIAPQRRSTRSQTKRITSKASASQQSPVSTQNEVADSDDGSAYEDEPSTSRHFDGTSDREPNDGLVACPSCSRRMKESLVNSHLDKCLTGEALSPSPPTDEKISAQSPRPPHIVAGTIAYTQTKPSSANRLPTLNYSLLNDIALRKKLKELGIPNHGSKELLRKRHLEWLNLWNANCDSLHPVTKLQLLKDLGTWERTLGRQVEKGQQGPNGVMVKDFDRDRYVKKQRNEFDDLIAKARQNRAAKETEDAKPSEGMDVQREGCASAPMQVDGSADAELEPATPHRLPAARNPLMEATSPPEQQSESRTTAAPDPDARSMPAFDWIPQTRPDMATSDAAHQPPPSSQRSMSRDITA